MDVEMDYDSHHRFRVTAIERHPRDELPAAELFRTASEPTLTLITCGGRFNAALRTYDENIVVKPVPA